MPKGILKICGQGHRFYKSSDCPTCPICDEERRPKEGFLSLLAAPARRAFEAEGLISLKQISSRKPAELLAMHGVGPSTIKQLRDLMKQEGLSFK